MLAKRDRERESNWGTIVGFPAGRESGAAMVEATADCADGGGEECRRELLPRLDSVSHLAGEEVKGGHR
jgi:hypothetical protein